jgi:hypothetical protein
MKTVGIADIQRNISLLSKAKEPFRIVNKRNNEEVARVYPTQKKKKKSVVSDLAGKYAHLIPEEKRNVPFEKVREIAMNEALKDKYGRLH